MHANNLQTLCRVQNQSLGLLQNESSIIQKELGPAVCTSLGGLTISKPWIEISIIIINATLTGHAVLTTNQAVAMLLHQDKAAMKHRAFHSQLEGIVTKCTMKQVWHRSILKELKFDILKTLTIFSEHQAAVSSPWILVSNSTYLVLNSAYTKSYLMLIDWA